jgi:oligopeptide/dipeptide ABC transporter ATP-binding protein
MSRVLLKTEHLKKYFPLKSGLFGRSDQVVQAVDDISFSICEGETLGLVGESGSGKTTVAKILLGLLPPTEGTVSIDGKDIYSGRERKEARRLTGAVFQDPASSLNPRNTVFRSLERPLILNGYSPKDAADLIRETAGNINIGLELLDRFPHELSGGQQQRISIARAIMLRPKLLVLDEPTSALDVSVQAQTLNELLSLQQEFGLTYLFITHNLSVVRYMSDRICVMYGGKLMEAGSTDEICDGYRHPYTVGLMSSAPPLHPRERNRKKYILSGEMPSLIGTGPGCRFYSRCSFGKERCSQEDPVLGPLSPGHLAACHYAGHINFKEKL